MNDRSMPDATLEDFADIIRRTYPNEAEGSEEWNAKIVLLSSLKVGQSPEALSRFTHLPLGNVALMVQRMVENGLWIGGEWVTCNLWSGEDSGTDFGIAQNVALGLMLHDPATSMFRLSAAGMERVRKLTRREETRGEESNSVRRR